MERERTREADLSDHAPNSSSITSAFAWGGLGALGVSLLYGVLTYPIDLRWGLIAIGVLGGWIIGSAARKGAGQTEPHLASARLRPLAALLGVASWLGAIAVAYLFSQALFPDATTPLLERLSVGGLGEFLWGTFDLWHGLAIGALALFGWRSAG